LSRVMAIVAHCDDEVLGCGGALALHRERGDQVRIIYLVVHRTMRHDAMLVDENERTEALRILDIDEHKAYTYPDQRLWTKRDDIRETIEKESWAYKPEIVYTHFWKDQNKDHQIVCEETRVALRFYRSPWVKSILHFEIPGSIAMRPTTYIEIDIEKKLDAMRAYSSEWQSDIGPRSEHAIRGLAAIRGTESGFKYAEGFVEIRRM
jgi:LmbE family N-acetylglucosaminyl deacetylase